MPVVTSLQCLIGALSAGFQRLEIIESTKVLSSGDLHTGVSCVQLTIRRTLKILSPEVRVQDSEVGDGLLISTTSALSSNLVTQFLR